MYVPLCSHTRKINSGVRQKKSNYITISVDLHDYYVSVLILLLVTILVVGMSTCVGQPAKRRTSDLNVTGSRPPAAIRHRI